MQFSGQAERDIYLFIKDYIHKQQISPLYGEVAEATGYSKKTVNQKVSDLVDKKLLNRIYGSTRGVYMP